MFDIIMIALSSNIAMAIYCIIAITIFGFCRIAFSVRKATKEHDAFREFYLEFDKFIKSVNPNLPENADSQNKSTFDEESYVWILRNSSKIHATFRLGNIVDSIKVVASITREGEMDDQCFNVRMRHIVALYERMEAYDGELAWQIEKEIDAVINPLMWLQVGLSDLSAMPISIFGWTGIIGKDKINKFLGGTIGKSFRAAILIIGFLASLKTMFPIQWDRIVNLIAGLFS